MRRVTRQVSVEDLVDIGMIADRLGLAHRQTANNLSRRYPDFPQPLGTWSRVRLWAWPDVEKWARETGRLPGR